MDKPPTANNADFVHAIVFPWSGQVLPTHEAEEAANDLLANPPFSCPGGQNTQND